MMKTQQEIPQKKFKGNPDPYLEFEFPLQLPPPFQGDTGGGRPEQAGLEQTERESAEGPTPSAGERLKGCATTGSLNLKFFNGLLTTGSQRFFKANKLQPCYRK